MRTTKSRAIVAATAAIVALGTISIQPASAAGPQNAQITKQSDAFSSQRRHRHWRGGGGAAFGAGAVLGAAAGLALSGAYYDGYGGYYGTPYAYEPYPYYGAPYAYGSYGYAPAPRVYSGPRYQRAPQRNLEMAY